MGRKDLFLLLGPAGLMGLAGLGLACPLIALQGANPARHILTANHYRAYYPFYALGEHLNDLSWLGLGAAGLALVCLLLWCLERFQIVPVLRTTGTRLPLARLILLGAQSWWWLLILTVSWFLWVMTGTLTHPESPLWTGLLATPPFLAAAALVAIGWRAWRRGAWQDLRGLSDSWSSGVGGATLAVGSALLAWMGQWMLMPDPLELAQGAPFQSFLVPPFLWSHFGPWGILGWQVAAGSSLGLALGIGVCGLTPDSPEGEVPLARRVLAGMTALVALLTLGGVRATLMERYQVGYDLRSLLDLHQETIPGRTVAWLSVPRPAHRVGPRRVWLSPGNAEVLAQWLVQAPIPSAQTRCAIAGLGNQALWQWDPDRALTYLAAQRNRQVHNSQLDDLMVQVLLTSSPSAERQRLALEFTNGDRFAWPGPEPLTRVGNLVARCGRGLEARGWLDQARDLDGVDRSLPQAPSATVDGRLLIDGTPRPGVRVALFAGSPEKIQRRLDEEAELVSSDKIWNARNRPSMSQAHLGAFYAVAETDSQGRFQLAPLDPGQYWVLARIPGGTADLRIQEGCGVLNIKAGEPAHLGELHLQH